MLDFKKLFLGLLLSVLFSAVLIAVCAFMILKLGFLPSEPILGTAAFPFLLLLSLRRASRGKKACCTALCLACSMQFSMLR